MTEIKPLIEFKDGILKLHMLYSEKRDNMTDREKEAFCDYFNHISRPMMVCNARIDLDNLQSI